MWAVIIYSLGDRIDSRYLFCSMLYVFPPFFILFSFFAFVHVLFFGFANLSFWNKNYFYGMKMQNKSSQLDLFGSLFLKDTGYQKLPWSGCKISPVSFNVIRSFSEKSEGLRITRSMRAFYELIRDCRLVDPPLTSGTFTLSNT